MLALSSIEDLYAVRKKINELNIHYPDVYKALRHVTNLTRQMQIKYQYLGCLLLEQDSSRYQTTHMEPSVQRLYLDEVMKLKNHEHFNQVRRLFLQFNEIGYENVCKLILGKSPETLKGTFQ
ncbi:hypothetical protein ACE1TI_09875 [Alteribacillus sp. JSM 102045]|uniref:hypothetical protein n=1 Tax=Alteribacillus sp. JSM 102045 TaxID=1562101 RepID=UPI0035C0CD4D